VLEWQQQQQQRCLLTDLPTWVWGAEEFPQQRWWVRGGGEQATWTAPLFGTNLRLHENKTDRQKIEF
jgi:hypothetical protein